MNAESLGKSIIISVSLVEITLALTLTTETSSTGIFELSTGNPVPVKVIFCPPFALPVDGLILVTTKLTVWAAALTLAYPKFLIRIIGFCSPASKPLDYVH